MPHSEKVTGNLKEKKDPPFTSIAPYYDILMNDVDYEKWVFYIEDIFKSLRFQPRKILDLACGTGTISVLLSKKGYSVTGADLSSQMLDIAKKKQRNEEINFIQADMRRLNLGETFDAIISIFDSINNLLTEGELMDTFQGVERHLSRRGVFLFDLNTIYCLSYYWGDRTRVRENEGITSIWKSSYEEKLSISRLDISLYIPEGDLYRKIEETHFERGYKIETIDRLLKKAGFKKRFFFDHLTFRKPRSTTLRYMVVALKGG